MSETKANHRHIATMQIQTSSISYLLLSEQRLHRFFALGMSDFTTDNNPYLTEN